MTSFESTFKRLQEERPRQEPTKEEVARATYERQQTDYARDYNDPVNVRYREILGMMATTLIGNSFPQESHVQTIYTDRE